MNRQNPTLDEYLPALMQFIRQLSENYRKGEVSSWDDLVSEVENFFTPQNQKEVELALPGWDVMRSYENGLTQVHTIAVLVAIMTSPEYERSTEEQKGQMKWCGLLHDISKRVVKGQPDLTHAFRSGAQAVPILLQAGFWYAEIDGLENWITLTKNAVKEQDGREFQDNSKLPEIITGLDDIFKGNRAALIILKAVLFHWSFTTVKEWPCAAPLTADEVSAYLDDELLQILGPLILADSESWNLFDHETKERYRIEIAEAVDEIGALLEMASAG